MCMYVLYSKDGIVHIVLYIQRSIMSQLSFATLDIFTDTRFKGNPFAIVQIPSNLRLEQDRKQAIASEFNLSETVFLHHGNDESSKTSGLTSSLQVQRYPLRDTQP